MAIDDVVQVVPLLGHFLERTAVETHDSPCAAHRIRRRVRLRSLTHHNTVGFCLPVVLEFAPSTNAVVAQINALPGGEWKFAGVAIMTRLSLVRMVVQLCCCFLIGVAQPMLMLLHPSVTRRFISAQ